MTKRMTEQTNERATEQMNERVTEQTNERVTKQMNEWNTKCRTNGQTPNEWPNANKTAERRANEEKWG